MKSRRFYLFFLILLVVLILQDSIVAQTPTPTPEIPAPLNVPENININADLIHPGDLIDVDVIGSVEYDWRGTLNPEGFLNGIDFAENPVFGLCRSEGQIAEDVAKAYGKILREPKVVVKILDRSNRPLAVVDGAIKTPQRLQIKRPFFLNELIILGGGLTERSSGEVQIFRQKNLNCLPATSSAAIVDNGENRQRFVSARQEKDANFLNIKIADLLAGKQEANPQILSGDIITVLEAEAIYVIGGVANPKQISFRSRITLSRAIASAGGIIKGGNGTKITIYRREAGETKIIEADLEKAKIEESADVVLQPFDIIEVAQNGREKNRFPPVLTIGEAKEKKANNLPLRVID